MLFRIDPTPYQNEVHSLEARLAADEAKVGADRQRLGEAQARLTDAQSSERAAARAVEPGHGTGGRRSRLRSIWRGNASRRTPSSSPRAPATASISSKRRRASTS